MAILFGTLQSDNRTGTDGRDLILGLFGDDKLDGLGGDDTILGGPGDDSVYGGGGDNVIDAGLGNDSVIAGFGEDTVNGGPGDDFLDGAGVPTASDPADVAIERRSDLADRLYGGSGQDTIFGAGGDDTIDGGSGDDTVRGGGGVDRLTGGPGDDTFVFGFEGLPLQFSPQEDTGTGEGMRDVITDFQQGRDLLDLTGYGPTLVSVDQDPENDRTILSFQVSRGSGQIELLGVLDLTEADFSGDVGRSGDDFVIM
jgi:Ca2+-binding RTX toxin-like protein